MRASSLVCCLFLGCLGPGTPTMEGSTHRRVEHLGVVNDVPQVTRQPGGTVVREIKWTSSSPQVASVSPEGQIIANGPGHTTVTARIGQTDLAWQLTVSPPTRIAWLQPPNALPLGTTSLVRVDAWVEDQQVAPTALRWSSSAAEIISIDSVGRATAHAPGRTYIHASLGETLATLELEVQAEPTP